MKLPYVVLITITFLFCLAVLNKPVEILDLFATLTSNLISGYLGYIVKQLEE